MPTETLLTQLGIGAVFVLLYFQLRKEYKEERDKMSDKLEKTNERIIGLVENNTQAMTGVKGSIDANTKSTDNLAQMFRVSLKKKGHNLSIN